MNRLVNKWYERRDDICNNSKREKKTQNRQHSKKELISG